jgi:hypothetical protein
MTAMTVFFPLDTIRSRLQLEDNRKSKDTLTMIKELIEEEGVYVISMFHLFVYSGNPESLGAHYIEVFHPY